MKPVLVLLVASYAGASVTTWWLSGFVPAYFLPDVPFLAVVYAGLFLPDAAGFAVALAAAFAREIVSSAPPWSLFFGSLALFFVAREIGLRLFVRTESFVVATVGGLLLVESASVAALLALSGNRAFSLLWAGQEAVRIAWTSLVAVPLFMNLSMRWRRVRE